MALPFGIAAGAIRIGEKLLGGIGRRKERRAEKKRKQAEKAQAQAEEARNLLAGLRNTPPANSVSDSSKDLLLKLKEKEDSGKLTDDDLKATTVGNVAASKMAVPPVAWVALAGVLFFLFNKRR